MMVYSRVSLYALMLAAAGIPLYIHLPRFASVNLGIDLSVIATILLLIRFVDLFQDPFVGWAIDRWPHQQATFALLAAGGLAIGFPLLFSLGMGENITLKLTMILILLFSAYSLGMILLYGRSATLAQGTSSNDLMTLAAYREAGMLAGVVIAAIAPTFFAAFGDSKDGYQSFGLFLGAVAVLVALFTRPIWQRKAVQGDALSFSGLIDSGAIRLLALALVNSLPVALTSTLFLFFVEDRLQLTGKAGILLLCFFAAAGLSVPFWLRLTRRVGAKMTLIIAMPLSILGFVGAAFLSAGNLLGFLGVCIASGVALGADMVVLPAMFSLALTKAGLNASSAFGLWSFAGKLGLALAAFFALPLLQSAGFAPGQVNDANALNMLNAAYAILPCILKLVAFGLVLTLPTQE